MEIVFWILLCMLAFVGAVEIFGRLFYGIRPPKPSARGMLVVRLQGDTAAMRETLEYYRAWIEWNGEGHELVFLCGNGDDCAKDLYERFLGGLPGVELADERQFCARCCQGQSY